MWVFVMTSLPAADCSMSLLLQWEMRGRRWFEGMSMVQPVPRSMMTLGVVDLEVQRLAADRQSCRPARVHGDTGTPTWRACTRFAAVHAANGVGKAAVWCVHVDLTGTPDEPLHSWQPVDGLSGTTRDVNFGFSQKLIFVLKKIDFFSINEFWFCSVAHSTDAAVTLYARPYIAAENENEHLIR